MEKIQRTFKQVLLSSWITGFVVIALVVYPSTPSFAVSRWVSSCDLCACQTTPGSYLEQFCGGASIHDSAKRRCGNVCSSSGSE